VSDRLAENARRTARQSLSRGSSHYDFVIPDYEKHPDVYSRTWILLEWVGSGKRVLELGCSTGFMSQYMAQKRGCSVLGVEIDADAAEEARKFCREVLVRDLSRPDWIAGIPNGAFDVVLVGDVLEHMADPVGLLLQIRPLLDSNGSLVISLPNVVHWLTRLKILFGHFDYEPGGTLDHTHLRFYTPTTARKMIESSGYTIRKYHPAFGGRLSGHARPVWQRLANWFPGLFAFQVLFEADRQGGNTSPSTAKRNSGQFAAVR
jgi:2-polyprenyl-3-methyl-5-hydroxy-6-metoxy-1,4-benzoquinol methylase